MKERPILFSGHDVRAILKGRKTQTRRIVKPQPRLIHAIHQDYSLTTNLLFREGNQRIKPKYGVPGDRLWVRETWGRIHPGCLSKLDPDPSSTLWRVAYRADGEPVPSMQEHGEKWRPSIHLPRWASRITLEITSVRVERLQEITEEDAEAEGAEPWAFDGMEHPDNPVLSSNSYRIGFQFKWESINGPGSWDSNPWVWVIGFRRVEE